MKANQIRKLYLDYFESNNHNIVESSPIIIKDDPTLMFVNAGMNQFKNIFLGDLRAKDLRVANSQKCLRVSGKHNDLEEVGHDTYHHTMFEMLGSWSFGDYFKEEAIRLAWMFLTDICKLEKDRLYVTVFEGSNHDNLLKDNESFAIWKKYLPESRIINGNKKDNFWEMGDTGPCGPCSEIHYDNRKVDLRNEINALELINKDHPDVIEIWNLVFIQYNRFSDGRLESLPEQHVDTGMGLERLTMIIQGKESSYETDIFQPIISNLEKVSEISYGHNKEHDIALRVVADHIRAIVFCIADGQLPSNVKAGYVIRRILRKAVRYGYTFLDIKTPFLYNLVDIVIDQFKYHFKELEDQRGLVKDVIKDEEETFFKTLDQGIKRINEMISISKEEVSGEDAFELYDTFGFPVDLTELILRENDLSFDMDGFNRAMDKQKKRSKNQNKLDVGDWIILIDNENEDFAGYNIFEKEVLITRYREVNTKGKTQYQIVFNSTPFYPEGGGQVGDIGEICNTSEKISIKNTKKENNLIIHYANSFPKDAKSKFLAKINIENRMKCSRNHTATHLLQQSLISNLGAHIQQKGSLVCADYLRFDFTHFSKISEEDLRLIEMDVNNKLLSNIQLQEHLDLSMEDASQLGAIMLFGEKYADRVRMIQFGESKELCGGTHVNQTGEIGLFKILSESSIASGVRRIDAITGVEILRNLNSQVDIINDLKLLFKGNNIVKAAQEAVSDNKRLQKEITKLKKQSAISLKKNILKESISVKDVSLITKNLDMDSQDMRNFSFMFKDVDSLILVLSSVYNKKVYLSVFLSQDLIEKGYNANDIIKHVAKDINGSGGGQSFFAMAGGDNINGIEKAYNSIKSFIK